MLDDPLALFFSLLTEAPTDAGGRKEVTGGSYVRVPVTNNDNITSWPAWEQTTYVETPGRGR